MIIQVRATSGFTNGVTGTIVSSPYDGMLACANSVDGVQSIYDMRFVLHDTNIEILTVNHTALLSVTLIK